MKKIVIKLKSEKKQINKKDKKIKLSKKNKDIIPCPICGQHMDICVTSHKNKPFVDNKMYPKMCFTCFSVPKILDQKYDEKGYIIEEKELEYSKKNTHTPEELCKEGSADSFEQAKKSVSSVKKLVLEKEIKNKTKPKLEFYLNE